MSTSAQSREEVFESCVTTGDLEVCAPREWREVLLSKLSNIKVHKSTCIGSRVSLYRLLLIRILGIRTFSSRGRVVTWAITRSSEKPECSEVTLVSLSDEEWFKLYSRKLPRLVALLLSEPLRVLIFAAIGGSGLLVNLVFAHLTYTLLAGYGYIANPLASTTGFEMSVIWNFTLHERVTFRRTGLDESARSVLTRLVKYHLASIGSWATQVLMATLLPLLLKTPFILAQLIGVLLGFVVNFILGYVYTWSIHRVK